jgi:hypothetical protein
MNKPGAASFGPQWSAEEEELLVTEVTAPPDAYQRVVKQLCRTVVKPQVPSRSC